MTTQPAFDPQRWNPCERRGRAAAALLAVLPALVGAAAALAGCASQRYALPMTADEQRSHQEVAALIAYLGQPGASGSVCDPRSGPSALLRDGEAAAGLVGALGRALVPAGPWGRCVADWLAGAGPAGSTALLERLLAVALDEIESPALDLDAARAARLDALIQAYAARPSGQEAGPPTVARVTGAIRTLLATGPVTRTGPQHDQLRQPLAPGARVRALALARAIDPVKALGRPVDAALLDELEARGDEATLRQLAARLRDEPLRTEARRRIIRLHVAASAWPEVRGDAAAVEAEVLRTGANAVGLEAHPIQRAWLEPEEPRTVLVEQRPAEGLARLLAVPPAGGLHELVPERPLRAWLRLDLAGLSAPVTLCAPPAELEVAPCLPPGAVAVAGTLATIDPSSRLHLRERLSELEAVALARGGSRLAVPILVAGQPVVTAAWPLAFATPPELAFDGAEGGGPGPVLMAQVEALAGGALVLQVQAGAGTFHAVVPRPETTSFRVVSRGGRGAPGPDGWPGRSGSDGLDGWDASCPSFSGGDGGRGGDGSDGGDGGVGGPGGPGGEVLVALVGGGANRTALLARLRQVLVSEGGAGGPGGRGGGGGAGGRGGRGGGSASCSSTDGTTSSLSGGSSGASGASGRSGRDGPAGRPGQAGAVLVEGRP